MNQDGMSVVERIARELLDRDGTEAAGIARERAELEERLGDVRSAIVWRYIADEIEWLISRPGHIADP